MAATCKTVQFVDTRIEPMPNPVYDYVIAPTQNQFYKIPASGLSNSGVNFNNLTTLGVDRAYCDTFELEVEAEIQFNLSQPDGTDLPVNDATEFAKFRTGLVPAPDEWTFQSFPFNTCCETARVNINGGTFFSEPLSYVRAKERYMNQDLLSRSYQNVCPVHRPMCQTESGLIATQKIPSAYAAVYNMPTNATDRAPGVPSRYGRGIFNYGQSEAGLAGGFNNSILRLGAKLDGNNGYANYYREPTKTVVKVTWREPIFCSPFSNRYDATYGRPLYNITSMDLYFAMQNLGNMIRIFNYHNGHAEYTGTSDATAKAVRIKSYTIDLKSVNLCYQVMTIPATIQKPLSTLVPYRRFVPYLTDFTSTTSIPPAGTGQTSVHIDSGVYTLNEIPTAIWVFCAPAKLSYQNNPEDYFRSAAPHQYDEDNCVAFGCWDSNKLFAYLQHIEIKMANTTQILNEAKTYDLYRIAKANGCEDSYMSWAGFDTCNFWPNPITKGLSAMPMAYGAGSVLRLKPGVDLIVPDIPLIPGANANNMVFQVAADYVIPPHSATYDKWTLWVLFEYVGVASISPGMCEITMNPLGTGEIMGVSPIMSATSEATEGKLEGSGFWDGVKRSMGIASQIADDGVLSMILRRIPGAEKAADWAKKHGLGGPGPCKRGRSADYSGGAVMGKGMDDWI